MYSILCLFIYSEIQNSKVLALKVLLENKFWRDAVELYKSLIEKVVSYVHNYSNLQYIYTNVVLKCVYLRDGLCYLNL